MPPRSSALRRRTSLHQAAHLPGIGIRVTDAKLPHTIEQHQGTIAAPCRRINSHAGPLESRRRASKRHMTGLMPTSPAFPPIWQFDVGPSTLQWEAPTSREHRRQKRDKLSISGLLNSLVDWLENQGSTDKPLIPSPVPPAESGPELVCSEAAAAVDSSCDTVAIPEEKRQDPVLSTHLPEEILLLRSSILELDVAQDVEMESKLYSAVKICKRSLRRRIERGELSVKSLLAALEPLDVLTRSRIPAPEMANKASAMIRRGILYAMADTHAKNPSSISHDLWLAFVNKLCATNGSHHDVQLFWRLMHIVPASLKEHLNPQQIRAFTCKVVAALASRHNIFAQWSSRAARLSQALQQLPADHQRQLDHDVHVFLSQQDWPSETAKRMRFAWLVIRAYDGQTNTQEFLRVYHSCLGPELRLNGLQQWLVLVARLGAVQSLDADSRKDLQQGTYTSMYQRWSALMHHVLQSSTRDDALRELCTILHQVGDSSSTTQALTSPPFRKVRKHTIEAIAATCTNHNQILALHDSIHMTPRANRPRQPLWSWSTWTKYIEAIIKDPEMDPSRIWQVLKLTYTPPTISQDEQLLGAENEAKTRLLDQMGQWFMEAHHLSDRQVLRNVQRCMNQQRALGKDVSSQILARVVEVINRDLERGQQGRTSRMRWLLGMVAEKHGVGEARNAASAWKGWRWTIAQGDQRPL